LIGVECRDSSERRKDATAKISIAFTARPGEVAVILGGVPIPELPVIPPDLINIHAFECAAVNLAQRRLCIRL
jgi:hypothetical protein